MVWLSSSPSPIQKTSLKKDFPTGFWVSCNQCSQTMYKKDFLSNLSVCLKCDYHHPLPVMSRINSLADEGSFLECDQGLKSKNPLNFFDSKPYSERLTTLQEKLGRNDAFTAGFAKIMGHPVQLGVFDFEFLGGSMGSVVGEKIARLFRRSVEHKQPAIIVTSSGGARMQEGIVSLFQMAKTCAALSYLRDVGVPFISILCHPTTGGVAASFAMLGDLNIGEPQALIGFAGPRVIQQTIGAKLPEGFQTAEYLLDHGMLDLICDRKSMRGKLAKILDIFQNKKNLS